MEWAHRRVLVTVLFAWVPLLALSIAEGRAWGGSVSLTFLQDVESLDGMLLNDYPGPKAQIQYGDGSTEFFCDRVEMFNMVLRPESARRIRAVYTQDMGKADWKAPRGHWIDARQAFYVHGSKVKGSMGPTFAAFARQEDAAAFAKQNGGQVLRFDEVRPEMADLHGGAAHDEHM